MTRLRRLTPTICAFHLGFSLVVLDGGPKAQLVHDGRRKRANRADATEQVNDTFLVVRETVGVETLPDGRVTGLALLVLVKQERSAKVGIKAKRKKAGWDFDYLLNIRSR